MTRLCETCKHPQHAEIDQLSQMGKLRHPLRSSERTIDMNAADLIRRYWYLIARNPLWLAGLVPGIDPRRMSYGDALRAASAYIHQETYSA